MKLNSQKSTGPKTPEGKAKSSLNRLSHGFASNTPVIPGEDPAELRALTLDFVNEYRPATVTEQVLVEKMAQNHWLSLRAFRLQGDAFLSQKLHSADPGAPKDLGVLIRYHNSAERAFHKAHSELVKAIKQRLNGEIGFEPQEFGEAVPTGPHAVSETPRDQPKTPPVVPISPDAAPKLPKTIFTDDELAFELCPEALEFFKKVG